MTSNQNAEHVPGLGKPVKIALLSGPSVVDKIWKKLSKMFFKVLTVSGTVRLPVNVVLYG